MKRLFIILIVLVVVVGAGYLIFGGSLKSDQPTYEFATISKGNLESTISATGTLSPLTTVEVGTQVSGTIDSVYVDYNDHVHEGEVLAVLDTLLLKTQVLDAQAGVERSEAALQQAQADFDRNQQLFKRQLISEADFLPYQVAVKTQEANLKAAQAALQRAQRNLQYAVIKSPIDGIVIERAVESGQTVAASLSTPTLFRIAHDLAHMEILAEVDESDIGQIKPGQKVRFEVQSYPNKTFNGVVRQVRLQPTTVSNVVTYTVVIDADNDNGLLLPGMTATIDFILADEHDVLLVSNRALRYQPTQEQLAAFRERRKAEMADQPDSTRMAHRARAMGGPGSGQGWQRPADMGMLWYVDSSGHLSGEPVKLGITDGINTVIVHSRDLTEGSKVISGMSTGDAANSTREARPMGFRGPHF